MEQILGYFFFRPRTCPTLCQRIALLFRLSGHLARRVQQRTSFAFELVGKHFRVLLCNVGPDLIRPRNDSVVDFEVRTC